METNANHRLYAVEGYLSEEGSRAVSDLLIAGVDPDLAIVCIECLLPETELYDLPAKRESNDLPWND